MKTIIRIFLLLALAQLSSSAQTVNATWNWKQYNVASSALRKVVVQPLQPLGTYAGSYLTAQPMTGFTDSNGSVTFTNLVSSYTYTATLYGPYVNTTVTNGFPSGLSGNVSAYAYTGALLNQLFYYYFLGTNSPGTAGQALLTDGTNWYWGDVSGGGGGAVVAGNAITVTTNGAGASYTVTVQTNLFDLAGAGAAIGAAATNYANSIGLSATNFALLIGQNGTNYALAVGASSTNLALAIGSAATNYANAIGLSCTNFALSIGVNETNLVNSTSNALAAQISANIGDPDALAYISANNITTYTPKTHLNNLFSNLKNHGLWNNLVDAAVTMPWLTGTNVPTSLRGNSMAASNLVFTAWAMQQWGTNLLTLHLPQSVTTNTVVIVFRQPDNRSGLSQAQWVAGCVNTNTKSATWLYSSAAVGNYSVWENQGGVVAYNSDNSGSYSNLLMIPEVSGPTYLLEQAALDQRKVISITRDGHGNCKVWADGRACPIGLNNPILNYLSPVVCADSLTDCQIGQTTTTNNPAFAPFHGEIAAVFVFNAALTDAQNKLLNRDLWYLENVTSVLMAFGDSRFAPDPFATNDPIHAITKRNPTDNTWRNFAQGGSKLGALASWDFSPVTNIPPDQITSINALINSAINDIEANESLAHLIGFATNIANQLTPYGVRCILAGVYAASTNGSTFGAFNQPAENIRLAFNSYLSTNAVGNPGSFFSGYLPIDHLIGQGLLNTNFPYSTDGTHMYGALGYQVNDAIARLYLGFPVRVGPSLPPPGLTVSPVDQNNDIWLDAALSTDGSALTNLQGTAIAAGTVNSNALDTLTKAQLALAGTGGGSGTVTRVGLSVPGLLYTVSGSPVTTSGTLTETLINQTANTVLAGPTSGGATTPTMRALVAADIPNLSASILTSGTVPQAQLPSTMNGANLGGASLNASNISGTLPALNSLGVTLTSGAFIGNGSGITNYTQTMEFTESSGISTSSKFFSPNGGLNSATVGQVSAAVGAHSTTYSNLYFSIGSALLAGTNVTVYLITNGVRSGITATAASLQTIVSDTTHSATLAGGGTNTWCWEIDSNDATTSSPAVLGSIDRIRTN